METPSGQHDEAGAGSSPDEPSGGLRGQLANLLARVEAASPSGAVEAMAAELGQGIEAADVCFWIADFSGRVVIRTDMRHPSGSGTKPLEGTAYGEVLRSQSVQVVERGDHYAVLAPVTNRGDAVGILEVLLASAPPEGLLDELADAAHALSYVVAASRQHTDLYEWGMRTTPFTLAAEIQRQLLPPAFSCEIGPATLAAWVEPSHDVGGDTFDYSVDHDTLHLSITDAMGHDLEGAMLATLLVGALRNGRRRGDDLVTQATRSHEALAEHTSEHQFVTGQLVRIDMASGRAAIVNAGHPPPYRVRDGRAEVLVLEVDLPFGVVGGRYREQHLDLRPGDRHVFITDGMIDRVDGTFDFATAVEETAGLHPREAVHALTSAVEDAIGGDLPDDATVLCLDWFGHEHTGRSAPSGSNQSG